MRSSSIGPQTIPPFTQCRLPCQTVGGNRRRGNVRVDLEYVFSILKKFGFRGYLTMEHDNPGDPYKETEELIAKTLAFLS